MKTKLLGLLACLLLVGCEPSPEQVARDNDYSLEHPQTLGVVDGHTIKFVTIELAGHSYPDRIYFVDGVVTDNTTYMVGKVYVTEATVTIPFTNTTMLHIVATNKGTVKLEADTNTLTK